MRWQRNEVAKSKDGGAGLGYQEDPPSSQCKGQEHGERQLGQEVGCVAGQKKKKWRQEGW